ncbi:MAG: histidine phosphatase family protein [Myxococcales bacterium]|nr:histidine phosphatase family protein [Myxococcales bacterium]
MLLTLVRHGDALPGGELGDRGRALSLFGRQQVRATGQALAERGVTPTRIYCSPLVRAVQTAEIIVAAIASPQAVLAHGDLFPESSPHVVVAELIERADPADDILLVGHQPFMSTLAGYLVGAQIGFSTGDAARIEVTGRRGALAWRWAPTP